MLTRTPDTHDHTSRESQTLGGKQGADVSQVELLQLAFNRCDIAGVDTFGSTITRSAQGERFTRLKVVHSECCSSAISASNFMHYFNCSVVVPLAHVILW